MLAATFLKQLKTFRGFFMGTCFGVLSAVCLLGFGATSLQAEEVCDMPVFGVHNVFIDQRADTATQAQTLGARAAAETAFTVLLQRLLNDQGRVEEFANLHDLDEFTDFVHISEENSLEGRYIARLNFCFDAPRLRAAMREASVSWAELPSPPILVIPVWKGPEGARAWQSDNEWLMGWRDDVASATGLMSFTLLEPTITNERKLRAQDLAEGDPVTLAKGAKIAGASQIMLVIAQLDYEGAQAVLTVSGQLLSDDGEGLTQLGRMVDLQVNDDLSMQLTNARQQILQELEQSWHAANLISGDETRELALTIPVSSLSQWASRLDVLENVAVINSLQIRQLKLDSGLVTLSLSGSMAALENALARQELQIKILDDGTGVLSSLTNN